MKQITYKILLVLTAIMVMAGCSNQLDVNPAQQVDTSDALKTSGDVEATLVGAYSNLGSINLYGGGMLLYPDLLASYKDINFFGTFQGLTQISNKEIPINNTFISDLWTDAYAAINTTNEVLNSLSIVSSVDRDRVEGEAKFIRGALYFELVKVFGRSWNDGDPTKNPGVPIILKPTQSSSDAMTHPARNTVSDVYAQVIQDLKDAESLLPTPENVAYYYATTGAATAMLSRVYLAKGDYANARDAANTVITSGVYKLMTNFADEFPYLGRGARIFNTTEDIFAQQVSEQNGTNYLNNFYAASDRGGRGDIEMDSTYLAHYEEGDDRFNLFYDDGGSIRTAKFDNQFGNIKIIRLAEMYLTRAEANYNLHTSVGATPVADINVIRGRAKLPHLTVVTLDQILFERYIELSFEGQWLIDYKRNKESVGDIPFDDPTLIFPIPQRETIVNKNLTQNDGY
jgi:hypothetical protein